MQTGGQQTAEVHFHLSSDPIVLTVAESSGDDRSRSVTVVVITLDVRALSGLGGNTIAKHVQNWTNFGRPMVCSFAGQSIYIQCGWDSMNTNIFYLLLIIKSIVKFIKYIKRQKVMCYFKPCHIKIKHSMKKLFPTFFNKEPIES